MFLYPTIILYTQLLRKLASNWRSKMGLYMNIHSNIHHTLNSAYILKSVLLLWYCWLFKKKST